MRLILAFTSVSMTAVTSSIQAASKQRGKKQKTDHEWGCMRTQRNIKIPQAVCKCWLTSATDSVASSSSTIMRVDSNTLISCKTKKNLEAGMLSGPLNSQHLTELPYVHVQVCSSGGEWRSAETDTQTNWAAMCNSRISGDTLAWGMWRFVFLAVCQSVAWGGVAVAITTYSYKLYGSHSSDVACNFGGCRNLRCAFLWPCYASQQNGPAQAINIAVSFTHCAAKEYKNSKGHRLRFRATSLLNFATGRRYSWMCICVCVCVVILNFWPNKSWHTFGFAFITVASESICICNSATTNHLFLSSSITNICTYAYKYVCVRLWLCTHVIADFIFGTSKNLLFAATI